MSARRRVPAFPAAMASGPGPARASYRALLVLLLGAATAAPALGGVSVNRCVVRGEVLYTDQPCPGARVLAIDAGAAATDAAQRLQRDQQRLDEGAARRYQTLAQDEARRRAEDERLASLEAQAAAQSAAQAAESGYDYGYGYAFGFAPRVTPHGPARHHAERRKERRITPQHLPSHVPVR